MKLWVLAVGRPSTMLAGAIAEYETRARRYWSLDTIEVRPVKGTSGTPSEIRAEETARLLAHVPEGVELVPLTRRGSRWSSERLASYLERLALWSKPGAVFLIGGALGLDLERLTRAQQQIALSPFTLPHDLARLVLAEQLYRAGTIVRGEPYHKG